MYTVVVYKLAFKIDDHYHVSWCRPSSYSLGQSISRFIADLLFSIVLPNSGIYLQHA